MAKIMLLFALFLMLGKSAYSDHDILDLTSETFDQAIGEHKYIMVNFYSPSCTHCEALAPEYVKVSKELHAIESTVKIARVDATKEVKLAEKYGIDGYPTLKLFIDGKALEYNGPRKADKIAIWLTKKSGSPATVVSSAEELDGLIKNNSVIVAGFLENLETDLAKAFLETALFKEHVAFALVQDKSLFSKYEVDGEKIIMFKDFDEGKVMYTGKPDVVEVSEFVHTNSIPLVIDFSYDFAPMIFSGNIKNHVLLFASTKADNFAEIKDTLTKLAKAYKGKLMFIVVDSDKNELKTISSFFGVPESESPALRIVSLGDEMQKFKPSEMKLDEESIKKFIEQFLADELKPDLLSEEVPEDWDKKSVKTLVGKNFNEVVNNPEKTTLVMFYAPWCGHCKKLEPMWDELGEKYKDLKNVTIAKMDSTKNEIEHFKIRAFPTVKIFLKDVTKSKDYNGERTVDGIIKFIESGGMDGGAVDIDDDTYDDEEETTGHDEL